MSIKRGPPPPKKRQQDILSTDNSKQPVMTLQQIMASYQNVERIPSSILPTILQTAFPSSKIVHTYNDDHYVVMASIRDMVNVPHGRWEFNRPADRPRCEEMALSIVRAKKPLSTMIYLTFDNQKQIFEIYDGNNRVTTFDIISERNTQVNLVSSNEFEKDLSWLFDFKITLDIHFNATRGEMMDNFEKLNKCIPVSELYHRDVANDKRICVEKEVAFWTKEYKTHFMTTSNPNKPNTNRDQFANLLSAVYDKLRLTDETKDRLHKRMIDLNEHIGKNVPKSLSDKAKEKCVGSGCWIFIYAQDKLIEML